MGNSMPNVAGKFNLSFEYYLIITTIFLKKKLNCFIFTIKIIMNKVLCLKMHCTDILLAIHGKLIIR